jgi:hypothetical protein
MAYPETSPILDFVVVDTHNPLTLGLADTSFYPSNFEVLNPTFEITPPSFPKATVIFTVSALTIFNSNTLNITCVNDVSLLADLPDGIWTVRQSITPPATFHLQRSFIRTMKLEQKFGTAFLKTDLVQCNQDVKIEQMKVLDEIWFYIQAAIAAANQCNNLLAMQLYKLANTMLDNFIRDRCRGTSPTLWC